MSVRSFHHAEFPADRLRQERERTISVCVPAREEAATIARVVAPLVALRDAGVVDQVVVLDDGSLDGTGEIAARCGAEVVRPATLLTQFGPVLGKGDAMWRALTVLSGDLVCEPACIRDGLLPAAVQQRRRRRPADPRQNRHQRLEDLRPMAGAVLGAVTSRLRREGRLAGGAHDGAQLERPPLAELRAMRPAV